MVNMMGKEMGRTCRAAHSALLRRVVGRRLQSFAVGWGCPSHWTRLPSLFSANRRLHEIVYCPKLPSNAWRSMQRFASPTLGRLLFVFVESEAVSSTSHSTATSPSGVANHRLTSPSKTRSFWVKSSTHWAQADRLVRPQFFHSVLH